MPEKKPHHRPTFQKVILALAIAIVLTSFVMYGISVVYPGPEYEDYCPEELQRKSEFLDQTECNEIGGRWNEYPPRPCPEGEVCPEGWCDETFTCRKEFQAVKDVYERNVFVISGILGLAVLIAGFLLRLAAVSGGISLGGLAIIFISIVRYWSQFGRFIRLLLLGVLLVALIWIGYKKFKDKV